MRNTLSPVTAGSTGGRGSDPSLFPDLSGSRSGLPTRDSAMLPPLLVIFASLLAAFSPYPSATAKLDAIWQELGRDDEIGALAAYDHVLMLARSPGPVLEFLDGRVQPVPVPDPQLLQRLVADLDNRDLATRRRACAELQTLGPRAAPALRSELQRRPALELTRRIDDLLKQADQHVPSADELRQLRAVEVLATIGSAKAREILTRLSRGADGAELTRKARTALERLPEN
jgi:hypothetical protein